MSNNNDTYESDAVTTEAETTEPETTEMPKPNLSQTLEQNRWVESGEPIVPPLQIEIPVVESFIHL